jgi:alpha-D-ribose 1-methylphosphonate 5-triphosphate diphosphatase PhnM
MSERGEFVFSNARLVLEGAVTEGSLTIQSGRIAEVATGPAHHSGLDCEGDLLMPGLVELHTDHLERDRVLTLSAAVALVTANPARMAGFSDRGRLKPGLRADLVRVHETAGPPIVRGVWRQGSRVA